LADYHGDIISSRGNLTAAEPEPMSMPLATPRVRFNPYLILALAAVAVAVLALSTYGQHDTGRPPAPAGVEKIMIDAAALTPMLKSELARRYVGASKDLPRVESRTLYRHKVSRAWVSLKDAFKMTDAQREELTERTYDEQFYYNTGYGSPLSYARVMEVLAAHGLADVKGLRTLDFGCGGIGPVRLLACLGVDAVGVDIEPMFPLYYNQPGDQGEVFTENGKGRVTLITGQWPAQDAAKKAIGGNYDVIISKNTLKMGYIHPERPAPKGSQVELGVDDETFVKTVFDALKPGGRFLIYNICPHKSRPEEEYKPWSDGRCPFPKELLEKAGFKVVAFDEDDGGPCRVMARALGWDKAPSSVDLENDLFAHYTLCERPQ
jgi:SAM-dependent methyltransferase